MAVQKFEFMLLVNIYTDFTFSSEPLIHTES